MADTFQITCIHKTDRLNPHERISHIGGVANGKRWRVTQREAIDGTRDGRWRFYVAVVQAPAVWVIVATHNGNLYLKTENDGLHPNNLLSLPECPVP
jgi:hypothetical protein